MMQMQSGWKSLQNRALLLAKSLHMTTALSIKDLVMMGPWPCIGIVVACNSVVLKLGAASL